MIPTSQEIAQAVGKANADELNAAFSRIQHCVNQLSDQQIWWRSDESLNSIGNLLLHLCGNLKQWIISGVGGEPDTRQRQAEFDERESVPKTELLSRLSETVQACTNVLTGLTADDILADRRIQGFEVKVINAIVDSISHFRGHTQEIISMTRFQLGADYQFQWKPTTKEEGAAE